MQKNKILSALSKTYWLNLFPKDTLTALQDHSKIIRMKPKEFVFQQDQPANHIYVIASGYAKVFHITQAGNNRIMNIFGANEIVGEAAGLTSQSYPANCQVIVPSEIIKINSTYLMEALQEHPLISMQIVFYLNKKILKFSKRINDMSIDNVNSKIALCLLRLFNFSNIYFNREIIAEIAGCSRETVSRTLARFVEENIISLSPGAIKIKDVKMLENLAMC